MEEEITHCEAIETEQMELLENAEINEEVEEKEKYEEVEEEENAQEFVPQFTIHYNFADEAQLVADARDCFSSTTHSNFLKGCKWAPDGSCILTNSEDRCLRLFNLPPSLYSLPTSVGEPLTIDSVLTMKESELVYDYCWYPKMNSMDPLTCFFVSSSRDNPVHVWDAYTGKAVTTFKAHNHLDELVAAHSLCFSDDGTKLYCGFNKAIRVFDTSQPGKKCQTRYTYAKKDGQKGIISCIAMNPVDPNIYAAGSYGKQIGLYEDSTAEAICILAGQSGGITHLKFSPDGNKLYSGGRKDNEILCWDLRNLANILFAMKREVNTNQRIYFDLSQCGEYMASGNNNGTINVWNGLNSIENSLDEDYIAPVKVFQAHDDCVNGVSFHPTLPVLASASGQRRFCDLIENEDSDSCFSMNQMTQDNSLRLWWIGGQVISQNEDENVAVVAVVAESCIDPTLQERSNQ